MSNVPMPKRGQSIFLMFEQITPIPLPSNRYRIAEMMMTADGPRTRFTNYSCGTSKEAIHIVTALSDGEEP